MAGRRVDADARRPARRGRAPAALVREQRDRIALELIRAGGKTRGQVAEMLGITRRALYDIERRAPERLRPPRPWLRPDNALRAREARDAG